MLWTILLVEAVLRRERRAPILWMTKSLRAPNDWMSQMQVEIVMVSRKDSYGSVIAFLRFVKYNHELEMSAATKLASQNDRKP